MPASKCLVCGTPIVGRSDKKYCSEKCRYLTNNRIKETVEQPLRQFNRILRRNRSILKKLCPEGISVVHKSALIANGFSFHAFTSLYVTKEKQVYYVCYEYAFLPVKDQGTEKAVIVHWIDSVPFDPWLFALEEQL